MSGNMQSLTAMVASGEISLTPEAATKCEEACLIYAAGLEDIRNNVKNEIFDSGFGTLNSGLELAGKYGRLGEFTLPKVLGEHIAIAYRLAESFKAAGANYAAVEAANTSAIRNVGGTG